MKRRWVCTLAAIAAACTIALVTAPTTASAHADGGVDEAFVAPQMNQESYWEARFGNGADCTKYEGHGGYIPASYEIAVVHDGQKVRVYNPAPDNATALGPQNTEGNNAQLDVHYAAPHSWVMKCDIPNGTTTTTTTQPEETTTTTGVEDTTTTTGVTTTTGTVTSTTVCCDETTTTTSPETTTTPPENITSTTPPDDTTTTACCDEDTTTTTSFPPPFRRLGDTGSSSGPLIGLGSLFIAGGLALARRFRQARAG